MITFGVPSKVVRKQEKYPDMDVLTMNAKPEVKGAAHKFKLNKKAIETYGFIPGESTVSVAFIDNKVYICNSTLIPGVEDKDKYNLTLEGTFSNAKAFNAIAEALNLDTSVENEFRLAIVLKADITLGKLDLITESTDDEHQCCGNFEGLNNEMSNELESALTNVIDTIEQQQQF